MSRRTTQRESDSFIVSPTSARCRGDASTFRGNPRPRDWNTISCHRSRLPPAIRMSSAAAPVGLPEIVVAASAVGCFAVSVCVALPRPWRRHQHPPSPWPGPLPPQQQLWNRAPAVARPSALQAGRPSDWPKYCWSLRKLPPGPWACLWPTPPASTSRE